MIYWFTTKKGQHSQQYLKFINPYKSYQICGLLMLAGYHLTITPSPKNFTLWEIGHGFLQVRVQTIDCSSSFRFDQQPEPGRRLITCGLTGMVSFYWWDLLIMQSFRPCTLQSEAFLFESQLLGIFWRHRWVFHANFRMLKPWLGRTVAWSTVASHEVTWTSLGLVLGWYQNERSGCVWK